MNAWLKAVALELWFRFPALRGASGSGFRNRRVHEWYNRW